MLVLPISPNPKQHQNSIPYPTHSPLPHKNGSNHSRVVTKAFRAQRGRALNPRRDIPSPVRHRKNREPRQILP